MCCVDSCHTVDIEARSSVSTHSTSPHNCTQEIGNVVLMVPLTRTSGLLMSPQLLPGNWKKGVDSSASVTKKHKPADLRHMVRSLMKIARHLSDHQVAHSLTGLTQFTVINHSFTLFWQSLSVLRSVLRCAMSVSVFQIAVLALITRFWGQRDVWMCRYKTDEHAYEDWTFLPRFLLNVVDLFSYEWWNQNTHTHTYGVFMCVWWYLLSL